MSAANYPNPILMFTLKEEGGLSNDAGDPGGLTKWGVTHVTYDAWRKRMGQPPQSVALMTPAERDGIYSSGYWTPVGGDGLRSGIDLCVFDDGVNAGPGAANRLLGKVGGDVGDVSALIEAFCSGRVAFLRGIQGGALWQRFGNGWGARVGRCQALALKMAGGLDVSATITDHATNAGAAASKAKKQSGAVVVAPSAGAAATQQVFPLWVLIVILSIAAIVAAVLWWRSANHASRAAALFNEAKGVIHGL